MKKQIDIENKLHQLADNYKVPDQYFESLVAKMTQKTTQKTKVVIIRKYITTMMVAASVLLLLSIGYIQFHSNTNPVSNKLDSINTRMETNLQNDDLSDLTDDEIIDYLADENDIDLELDIE